MMLTSRQHSVLADLGISVWQRRQQKTSAPPQSAPSENMSASPLAAVDTTHARLIMLVDEPLDDSKQLLLGAMLKAVGLTSDQVATLNSQQLGQCQTQLSNNMALLAFGDAPLSEATQMQTHHCPGLDEMLQQPQRKALAWQALQKLKPLL